MKTLKYLVLSLLLFLSTLGYSQYKVSVDVNSIELYNNANSKPIHVIRNLSTVSSSNSEQVAFRKYVDFFYEGKSLRLFYDEIVQIKVGVGSYAAPVSFDAVVDIFKTNIINTSSGGGSGGDASASNQVTTNTKLTSIDSKTPSLGQAIKANSTPVTIASDNVIDVRLTGNKFFFSTLNSTTTQLAAAATYNGSIEDITGYPSCSLLLFGDQNGTLTVNQYINAAGTKLINQQVFAYTAGTPFSRSFTMNGNYIKCSFTNNGGSITTNFQLDTAYGVIDAVTQLSNYPMSINEVGGTVFTTGSKSAAQSIPTVLSVESTSGTITTQNLVPVGTATAGSAVEITLSGSSGLAIQTVGVYTGALSLQVTSDGNNWVTVGGTPFINMNTGGLLVSITSALQSTFQTESGGFLKARITALAAVTGSVVVNIRGIANNPLVSIDSALPTGTNSIGNLGTVSTVSTVTAVGTINTSIVPGVAATHLGKAEDAVSTSGDTGVFQLGVRRDAPLVSSSANGDYNEIATDKFGAILTKEIAKHKRTYSAAFAINSIATATDLFEIKGSATAIVSITKVSFTATQTTGAQLTFSLMKHSSANTGGTLTNASLISHDSNSSAATSVVSIYSAQPVISGASSIRSVSSYVSPTSTQNNTYTYDFGNSGQPILLNGIAQSLSLNIGGATMTSGSVLVWIEFTEE
jgi:hypothetical protein